MEFKIEGSSLSYPLEQMENHLCSYYFFILSAGECGHLRVTRVNTHTQDILNIWQRDFDGPLTSALLFKSQAASALPSCLQAAGLRLPEARSNSGLHLLVTYSLGPSLVFSDVQEHGLEKSQPLPSSALHDVVTCAWTADLMQGGQWRPPVLLLGTFGQELLAYSQGQEGEEKEPSWRLIWQKTFAAPVIGVRYADLTGDGVCELIVITTRGVQVLQHNLSAVKAKALRALEYLVSLAEH